MITSDARCTVDFNSTPVVHNITYPCHILVREMAEWWRNTCCCMWTRSSWVSCVLRDALWRYNKRVSCVALLQHCLWLLRHFIDMLALGVNLLSQIVAKLSLSCMYSLYSVNYTWTKMLPGEKKASNAWVSDLQLGIKTFCNHSNLPMVKKYIYILRNNT